MNIWICGHMKTLQESQTYIILSFVNLGTEKFALRVKIRDGLMSSESPLDVISAICLLEPLKHWSHSS